MENFLNESQVRVSILCFVFSDDHIVVFLRVIPQILDRKIISTNLTFCSDNVGQVITEFNMFIFLTVCLLMFFE